MDLEYKKNREMNVRVTVSTTSTEAILFYLSSELPEINYKKSPFHFHDFFDILEHNIKIHVILLHLHEQNVV